jgi:hypothetical protein
VLSTEAPVSVDLVDCGWLPATIESQLYPLNVRDPAPASFDITPPETALAHMPELFC